MAHENVLLRVSSQDLRRKAAELRNYNRQLRAKLQDLDSRERTLNSQWDGPANEAFHNQYQFNRSKFNAFMDAVEQYARVLEETAAVYEQRELQNVQIAKTV